MKTPPPPPSRMAGVTDEALIAECQKRGLIDRRGIVMTLLKQRDQALRERDIAQAELKRAGRQQSKRK